MPDPEPNVDPKVSVKVDHSAADPNAGYTPPDLNLQEAIPPEFRDKPYFKDKTFPDLVKDHVNLQTLLGQRPAGIPAEDAPDAEWGTFLSSLRPKSGDEYELPETEFSKEKGRSDEYVKAVKDVLFDANVNKRQATAILSGFEKFLADGVEGQATQTGEQKAARETEFEGLLDTEYKGEKQNVIERTKKLMTEMVTPELKEKVTAVLKDVSNETLFALTAVLEGVHKKYIAEDTPPGGGDNVGGDAGSLQAEAEGIMKGDTYKNFRAAGHDAAKQKVRDIFKQISEMKK